MHWIDIAVIITLLISGVFAYSRGFVHEVLSIAGWAGATFSTIYATPIVKPYVLQFINDPFISALVSGILLFIVTLIVLSLLTKQISKGVKESALGALDHALGFLFGIIRGGVILSLVWIGYAWFVPEDERPEDYFNARSIGFVMQGATILKALVPNEEGEPPSAIDALPDSKTLLDKAINAIPSVSNPKEDGSYGQKERSAIDRVIESIK